MIQTQPSTIEINMGNTMLIKSTLLLISISFLHFDAVASTLKMTFDYGIPSERIQSGDCIKYGEPVFTSTAGRTFYTEAESFGPGKSAELNVIQGSTGFGTLGGVINFPSCTNFDDSAGKIIKGQEIWVSVKLKFPTGFEFNQEGRNKFLRLRTFHDVDGTPVSEGYNDLYINGPSSGEGEQPFHYIFEGAQRWYWAGEPEDFFTLGYWNTVEFYLKLDNIKGSEGGDSMVRVWIDGKLIGETNDRNTLKFENSYISSLYFFTWWGNQGAHINQQFWADDLVITTETPTDRDQYGNPMIGTGSLFKNGFEL